MGKHGKRVTLAQAKILRQNGYKDSDQWWYLGTESTTTDGKKSPSKNGNCVVKNVFRNKTTGEIIKI